MRVKNEYLATAKDGQTQKFNAYPVRATGKFVTRFHVTNYKEGKHKQWCGKGCTHDTQAEAVAFGYKIASSVKKAGDFPSLKNLVDIHAAHKGVFG